MCDCASLAVSMSVWILVCQDTKAVYMPVCANVCALWVIRGLQEGVMERTQSRDRAGRRRT